MSDLALLWPDTHFPYQDQKAVDLVLQVAKHLRPNKLVILGDWVDCFTVSSHDRDPRRGTQLQSELDVSNTALDEVDELPWESKTFCMGNHEYRLQRYLVQNAPALLDTVRMDRLLGLQDRGYNVVKYRQHARIGKLYVTHEVGHAGVHAIHHTAAAMGSNVAIGHTHRLGIHYTGTIEGKRFVAGSFGWLGAPAEADYLHESQKRGWQTGFGIVRFDKRGNAWAQAIPIIEDRCIVEGRLYERKRVIAA